MSWFRKPNPPPAVKVIARDVMRIRLSQWRQSPELVKQANRFLRHPECRQMLDVVRNEAPASEVLIVPTLEERAIAQARNEGYMLALNNIEAMGTPDSPDEHLEATFEDPEHTR